jgi:hypothetical protein
MIWILMMSQRNVTHKYPTIIVLQKNCHEKSYSMNDLSTPHLRQQLQGR